MNPSSATRRDQSDLWKVHQPWFSPSFLAILLCWVMASSRPNASASSACRVAEAAGQLHEVCSPVCISPFLPTSLMCKKTVCRKRGPSSPWGQVPLHWAGCSGIVGQATALYGFCTAVGLELFRFRGNLSKLGYASFSLWHPRPSVTFMELARQPHEMLARTWG